MSAQFDPYAPIDGAAKEDVYNVQYDLADAIDTIELDGEQVKITEKNRFLVEDTSDYVKGDKTPNYDKIIYKSIIAAPLSDFKKGVTLVRDENMHIEYAKKVDVDENNMVVGKEREHQDLIGPIKGTLSTNINVPMIVQIPVENAPGIVSYNSKYATALVNDNANTTGDPSNFTLLEDRLTEKGLKFVMKNVGVARNAIKHKDLISSADKHKFVIVKTDSPVIRSIFEFLDTKAAEGAEPIIVVTMTDGSVADAVVREPGESETGGYRVPEIVYDYFHEDTIAHIWDNCATGDVSSRAFRPIIKIHPSFADFGLADGQDAIVRTTLLLNIPFKRLLRPGQ